MARVDTVLFPRPQVSREATGEGVCNRCVVSQGLPSVGEHSAAIRGRNKFLRKAHGLQPLRAVPRRASAQGFSLVELMVVVTIIAVVSALALPGAVQALRERKSQQAAISVLDIVRETRSRAMYRGVAHALVIETVGTAVKVDTWEGTSSSCRLSRFGSGLFDPAQRVYSLNLGSSTFARDGVAAQITVPTGASYLEICFTPLGVAYFSTTPISDGTSPSATWSNDSSLVGSGGSFVLDVYQMRSGIAAGVRRHVVIPLSGMPRMRS